MWVENEKKQWMNEPLCTDEGGTNVIDEDVYRTGVTACDGREQTEGTWETARGMYCFGGSLFDLSSSRSLA